MAHLIRLHMTLLAVLLMLTLPAKAGPLDVPKSAVVLTVSGKIANTNRGPFDETKDLFFRHLDVTFTSAAAFDRAMLLDLEQHTIKTDFPKGGSVRNFTGPRLTDVLALTGATGETVKITALDGYTGELPLFEIKSISETGGGARS